MVLSVVLLLLVFYFSLSFIWVLFSTLFIFNGQSLTFLVFTYFYLCYWLFMLGLVLPAVLLLHICYFNLFAVFPIRSVLSWGRGVQPPEHRLLARNLAKCFSLLCSSCDF
ncbi:MAG: hypothetical protein [Microviridae sp.]|nr:MAG: hypothetical protein [Microviridae sp.]